MTVLCIQCKWKNWDVGVHNTPAACGANPGKIMREARAVCEGRDWEPDKYLQEVAEIKARSHGS